MPSIVKPKSCYSSYPLRVMFTLHIELYHRHISVISKRDTEIRKGGNIHTAFFVHCGLDGKHSHNVHPVIYMDVIGTPGIMDLYAVHIVMAVFNVLNSGGKLSVDLLYHIGNRRYLRVFVLTGKEDAERG